MDNPLVKGIRQPHEVKKKSFDLGGNRTHDLRIRSTVTLPIELRCRTEKVGDDLGGESRRIPLPLLSLSRAGTSQGPQGTPSSKSIKSIQIIPESLPRLKVSKLFCDLLSSEKIC